MATLSIGIGKILADIDPVPAPRRRARGSEELSQADL
jgi:hypothetical protein